MQLSVILSVYNGGKYLKKSLESVLSQQISDLEILIVDDCSTDNSRNYLDSIRDERVKVFYNEVNKGLFSNLNFLIGKSSSELITLWSQDDIMYPDAIEKNIQIHKKYPQIGFSYASRDIINEDGCIIQLFDNTDNTPELIEFDLYHRICAFTGSISGNIANVTYKKKCLIEFGKFNTSMYYSSDFDMQVRVGMQYPVGRICESTYALRNHSDQLSKKKGYEVYQLSDDIKVFLYLDKYAKTSEQKEFLKRCKRSRRAPYYLAVWKKIIRRGNISEIISYGRLLNSYNSIPFSLFYFFICKIKLAQAPKL